MRFGDHHITKEFLLTADYLNTINGGMAMVSLRFNREKDHYITRVATPGITSEDLKVEIINNVLHIYHLLEFGTDGGDEEIRKIPNTLGELIIPFDVKMNNIHAYFEDGNLEVSLPFNEMAGGFRREIPIDMH